MIDRGSIVIQGPLDAVKAEHRRLTLRFDEPLSRPPTLGGVLLWDGYGQEWTGVYRGPVEEIADQAAGLGARVVEEHVPSLDEIFVARVGSRQHQHVGVEG
jgi:ABC-2 type transport system ATP-binding protein